MVRKVRLLDVHQGRAMSNTDAYLDGWLTSIRAAMSYDRLFVTGCPKSGTTWLMQLLNGHPNVVANGEGRFAWRLFGCLQDAVETFNRDQAVAQANPLGCVTGEDFTMMLRVAADNTLLRYLAASGKPPAEVRVLADKTPQHVLHAELLAALFPGCRFINIVRDPLDAATSALFHLAKDDVRSRGEYVTAFVNESWRHHVEAAVAAERRLGSGTFLNVRYEDLHADPDPVIARCLRHVGVDASPAAVAACRDAGSFERMSGGRQRGEADPTALCRNGLVGDWRNHIPVDLARAACAPVAELMRRFGYTEVNAVEPVVTVMVSQNLPRLRSRAQSVLAQ
jgi:hypothetical protein